MNRDETMELWRSCERERRAAYDAAVAERKRGFGAYEIGHEAAKAKWNDWAKRTLAERKALEIAGEWAANEGEWLRCAAADFTDVQFRAQGSNELRATPQIFNASLSLETIGEQINFAGFIFPADALFNRTQFLGEADFRGARYYRDAMFQNARFPGNAQFSRVLCAGRVGFEGAEFRRHAVFERAWFCSACFDRTSFYGGAVFVRTWFCQSASFDCTDFHGVTFENSRFSSHADFQFTKFSGNARFKRARFRGEAKFYSQTFTQDVFFVAAVFAGKADFTLATFQRVAKFDEAHFSGEADFGAVRGERAFSLADAEFEKVPNFVEAHFEEAPRLDNVRVRPRMFAHAPVGQRSMREVLLFGWLSPDRWAESVRDRIRHANRDMPARWRALKRLAIQGHDLDREHEYFEREIRATRFSGDTALPVPVWRPSAWGSTFRFYAGILYGILGGYGRSAALPFLWWIALTIIAGVLYLGERRAPQEASLSPVSAYLTTTKKAQEAGYPCFSREAGPNASGIGGLTQDLREQTSAVSEAVQLAFRTGLIVLDNGGDAAHRSYGCLYGVELYSGSNPVAVVPPAVSAISAAQKLFSAVLIFLFGLALRNMLKMK